MWPFDGDSVSKTAKESHVISTLLKAFIRFGYDSNQVLDQAVAKLSQTNTATTREQLAHELVLFYDKCRAHFDARNLQHQACSLIRAFNLTGQCKWTRELLNGNAGFYNSFVLHQKQCVRRKTKERLLSMQDGDRQSPWMEHQIDSAVEAVFTRCYLDTEPLWHPMTE